MRNEGGNRQGELGYPRSFAHGAARFNTINQPRSLFALHLDDERTIRGFLAGEPAAIERVDRWIHAAAKPFRGRLADGFGDVRQDVFAECTRLFGGDYFRGDSSLASYVWRITNHACIRQLRAAARWAPELSVERAGSGESAEDRLLRESRVKGLRRIIDGLSEECRELWRRVLAQQSYEFMAREMGVAAGTLRVRVLRCRQKALEQRGRHE
ncbi:MAG: sigma-70 family RNA polymerase sigma factor [Acidobacteria bacterium]|nr:sigma-70 family RNA polymerase sigma factor [Acidobacteriota bacterium]